MNEKQDSAEKNKVVCFQPGDRPSQADYLKYRESVLASTDPKKETPERKKQEDNRVP